MKRILSLLVIVMLLFSTAAFADSLNSQFPRSIEEARQYANEEIENIFAWENYFRNPRNINGSMLSLNQAAWTDHFALVYGQPFGTDSLQGRRYLGYNPLGVEFPNPNYPLDSTPKSTINNYKWVSKPWSDSGINQQDLYFLHPNEANLRSALRDKIREGLEFSYQEKFEDRDKEFPWELYTLIVQPPTKYTSGFGRMWHLWDSNKDGKAELWYVTMPLAPDVLPPDIEVSALTNESPVPTATEQVATAIYKNNSKSAQTFEALFYIADKVISTENITLNSGQNVTKNYAWTSPEAAGQIELKAEAKPVQNEVNTANNIKTLPIDVEEVADPVEPASFGCQEASSQTYKWSVGYSWRVKTGTDKDGKPTYSTRRKTENYSETLSATTTVNTKQGIANGGRESRGAWEIIPYAKQKGIDPNTVTRSGYGFEVKVVTTYNTDWETKNEPAKKKGGTYYGPDKVVADFYNTKGKFVKRTSLVPTQGKAGDKNITWELPLEKYTFQDGSSVTERKHYVDIDVLDGKYQVKVTISGAGKSDLCLIQKKAVTIYKDALEDTYTRVSTKDE